MHYVAADLDENEVFIMLVEEQLKSVPGCIERRREVLTPDNGIGIQGLCALQIPDQGFGTLNSMSRSRIIKYAHQTTIAQLTATELQRRLRTSSTTAALRGMH